jgi:hypothetical protein
MKPECQNIFSRLEIFSLTSLRLLYETTASGVHFMNNAPIPPAPIAQSNGNLLNFHVIKIL